MPLPKPQFIELTSLVLCNHVQSIVTHCGLHCLSTYSQAFKAQCSVLVLAVTLRCAWCIKLI